MSRIRHDRQELELVADRTIFDYADELQVRVPTSCGRSGECHECVVEIQQGMEALCARTEAESFLRENYRLACQATVTDTTSDIEFALLRREPKILTDSTHRQVKVDPFITRRNDGVYLRETRIDRYRGHIYGLAVDLGTTTVVFNLVDLETGQVLHTCSFESPQRFGGSDIMNRISYDGGEFHGELRQAILAGLNFEIRDLCRQTGIPRSQIYEVVVVGNSTMRDIFFGFDVQSIGEKPYKSVTEHELLRGDRETTALNLSPRDVGLRVFPKANIYGGPLVASHVGADIAAGLLAIGMDQQDDAVMLIDVGTNTEVVVGNRSRMMAASCPAGPAFEGGEITYGMPGYAGAVESVKLQDGKVKWRTIGDAPPLGICGSGLIDLLAELRRNGCMTELGVFTDNRQDFEFVPGKGMSLSRADISALAQAKAANFCGQQIVLRRYGLPAEQIDKVYLAGGFANYIDIQSARAIGFIPDVPEERIVKVGNAALQGATIMLVSKDLRQWMERTAKQIEHIELETTEDFFDIFVEGCMFQPTTESQIS